METIQEEGWETELYNAVDLDDVDALNELFSDGENANEFYYDIATDDAVSLLHIACRKGRLECVKCLVKNGAITNIADCNGQTPLMYACSSGNMDVAELLLQKDLTLVNDEDINGLTALDLAALEGNVEAIRLLSVYGANTNHQTFDGVTPVIRCIRHGKTGNRVSVLSALIEGGADVNIRDRRCKRSALHQTFLQMDVGGTEVLLAAGADMYSLDIGAKTPLTNMLLQYVRMKNGAMFIHEDIWTIMLLMVHYGIDYNHNVCEDADPLMTACHLKAEALVRFFLVHGANPNNHTVLGVTPLIKSTARNDLPSVKTLVEWNCRLDMQGQYYRKRDDFEYTVDAYQLALLLEHFDIAKFLIEAGYPHYNQPYVFGRAPLPKSLENNPEMVEWLSERCSNPESLSMLAVFAVRRAVGLDIVAGARRLPIPPQLKRRVALKDLLDIDVEY